MKHQALAVPDTHPSYEGHFPGAPVLPGAVLLDAVLAALEAGEAAGGDRRGRQSAAPRGGRRAGGYGGSNGGPLELPAHDTTAPAAEAARLSGPQGVYTGRAPWERPQPPRRPATTRSTGRPTPSATTRGTADGSRRRPGLRRRLARCPGSPVARPPRGPPASAARAASWRRSIAGNDGSYR